MYKVIALLGLAAFGTAIPISYIQDEIDELKHEVHALKKYGLRLERRSEPYDTIKDELKKLFKNDADPEAKATKVADKFIEELRKGGDTAKMASQMLETMVKINEKAARDEALMAALTEAGFVSPQS